jgi:hypothetical protein
MDRIDHEPLKMYSSSGEFLGVLIGPKLWARIKDPVEAACQALAPREEAKEPLADLDLLIQNWDFLYPVDTDVRCALCGNETPDWSKDAPRKFRLKAASLGGLVGFECQDCKARVLKRHFKREIQVQCIPCCPPGK